MRRGVVAAVLVVLAAAAPARAAPPSVTLTASATAGAAPLTVTFKAHGDAVSYEWELGNGETAEGPTASTTYRPGLWTASVTATAADGSTAQASVAVRSVAIALRAPAPSRYGATALFRGRIVPALAGEPVALYAAGRRLASVRAAPDGTFRLGLPRVGAPGRYEARTSIAASEPVALKVRPLLEASFVGVRAVGGRLVARVRPAAAGTLALRVWSGGRVVRAADSGPAASLGVATPRIASYRASARLRPAPGWVATTWVARPAIVSTNRALGATSSSSSGLVFRLYPGLGYRFQPLLSFAALNRGVSSGRRYAVRRLAAALLERAVWSGDALLWQYGFPFAGGPVPWRSGFAQAVAAQALARAGVMLGDPLLGAAAAAAFRGLRGALLMPLGGGLWIREYGFTHEAILNAQLQSIISVESYAAVSGNAAASLVAGELLTATRRLLPEFDLGCWARYELGGGAASASYQRYHVDLLRRLAASHPERIWRDTYRRWSRCIG